MPIFRDKQIKQLGENNIICVWGRLQHCEKAKIVFKSQLTWVWSKKMLVAQHFRKIQQSRKCKIWGWVLIWDFKKWPGTVRQSAVKLYHWLSGTIVCNELSSRYARLLLFLMVCRQSVWTYWLHFYHNS